MMDLLTAAPELLADVEAMESELRAFCRESGRPPGWCGAMVWNSSDGVPASWPMTDEQVDAMRAQLSINPTNGHDCFMVWDGKGNEVHLSDGCHSGPAAIPTVQEAEEATLKAEQLRQEELARQQADLERAAQAERAQQTRLQRFEHDRQEALAASRRLAEWSAQFAQVLNAFDDSRDALHGDPVNSAASCEQLGIAAAKLATILPASCPDRRVASLLKQAFQGYEQAGVWCRSGSGRVFSAIRPFQEAERAWAEAAALIVASRKQRG